MVAFGQTASSSHSANDPALSRLYKFAIVLTANEQLARSLLRGTLRVLNGRVAPRQAEDRDVGIEAMRRMYALWMAKVTDDNSLQQHNPPEARLFAHIPLKGSVTGNAHFAKFIAHMPSQQRAALYLVYGQGIAYDDAAEIIALNMMAMMKIIARGHLALANWLDHRGFTETPGGGQTSSRIAERAA